MAVDHGPPTEGWARDSDNGQCEYCGKNTKVRLEPFGQKPACWPCWALICFGEDDD